MKTLSYITIACMLFCSCIAQKNTTRIHAYKYQMMRGASPVAIADENLREPQKEQDIKVTVNYLIYVESAAADVQVKNVWISKVGYAASAEVVKSPVLMMHSIRIDGNPDTLVNQTQGKVLQVKPIAGSKTGKLSSSQQKKVAGNELVVHCVINGMNQYYTVAAIKKLPPVALQ